MCDGDVAPLRRFAEAFFGGGAALRPRRFRTAASGNGPDCVKVICVRHVRLFLRRFSFFDVVLKRGLLFVMLAALVVLKGMHTELQSRHRGWLTVRVSPLTRGCRYWLLHGLS